MQSIRLGLAEAIRNDVAQVRHGMAVWLLADATLEPFRAVGAGRARQICQDVLNELLAWLDDDDIKRVERARAALAGLRACLLARSYLLEYLKQESYPGTRSREEERAVVGLLDTFFTDAATFPGLLAPTLPPPDHVDRAGAGAEAPKPAFQPWAPSGGANRPGRGQNAPSRGLENA